MHHKYVLLVFIAILTIVSGCGRKSEFEKKHIKPVTTFSLGSAKFTEFTKPPTTDELIKSALKLYASFDSVAITVKSTDQHVRGYSATADNKAEDVELRVYEDTRDIRSVSPDKWFSFRHFDNTCSVYIINGRTSLNYLPSDNTYRINTPDKKRIPYDDIVRFTNLLLYGRHCLVNKPVLSEKRIKGTDVYVLNMRIKTEQANGIWLETERRTICLGKHDLLPRKILCSYLRIGEAAAIRGLPPEFFKFEFLGFIANARIPDSLFDAIPQKNSKRLTGSAFIG